MKILKKNFKLNNKILIIGRRGFIAKHLFEFLKKKSANVVRVDKKNVIIKKINFFKKFNWIINCTIHKTFVTDSYSKNNDINLQIVKKIKNIKNINFIMLSSRKVYKTGINITEQSKLSPNCIYSKNILKSEIELQKYLPITRLLVLRISNLIGYANSSSKKILKTFSYSFFENAKKGFILESKNIFKDFIGVNKFSEIVYKLILKNSYGIYNISIGQKIYLKKIIKWLNFHNKKKLIEIKFSKNHNSDCFTLSNDKLMKQISVNNRQIDLKKECLNLSKMYFNK